MKSQVLLSLAATLVFSSGVAVANQSSVGTDAPTANVTATQAGSGQGRAIGRSALMNAYVVALVPGAAVGQPGVPFVAYTAQPAASTTLAWGPLASGAQAFASNVSNGQLNTSSVMFQILSSLPSGAGSLSGTEFYLGYGTSFDEMIAAQRYCGIYRIL